ncbi:PAS domain-containing protein [Belnapia sp. T18]|uniref:histidine kinase n=1 Tax=Belnapia arida TaxID=2804533 RepID=A0ABS1U2L0_9PROT|nr:PAS domain-containing protein [Belnapia arida]MBL6078174.1 PAS domain-containing protein [Belnapia arida]
MSHQPVLSPTTHLLLRRISEAVPDPIAVLLAPDWRVVYANRSYRALAGMEGADIIGRKVADLFPGVIACGGLARLAEARSSGRSISSKAVRAVLRTGDPESWWDMDHHPLPDTDGDLGAVLVILRDITAEVGARQEAEAATTALRRRAEQMRLAIGAGRMYFWDFNVTTGAVEWSEGLAEACGMAPGSFGGTVEAFRKLVHPDDLARVEAAIGRALACEAAYDIEFRMLRADGGERWVLSRATVERDAAGRPVRMVGIDLDLTERKRAEIRLAESEARLRAMQEVAEFGTWEWDRDTRRQVWSPEQFALHGVPEREGAPTLERWLDLVHADDRDLLFDAARQGWAASGHRYRTLFRIRRADDGAERWLAALGRVLRAAPDGTPVRMRGINIDVTCLVGDLAQGQGWTGEHDDAALLRSVLDGSTDCTKVVEPDGTLSFMNANGLCLMEIDDFEKFRGREWASLWPEDSRARVRKAVTRALSGEADRFEALCPTARGNPKWWDVVQPAAAPGAADGRAGRRRGAREGHVAGYGRGRGAPQPLPQFRSADGRSVQGSDRPDRAPRLAVAQGRGAVREPRRSEHGCRARHSHRPDRQRAAQQCHQACLPGRWAGRGRGHRRGAGWPRCAHGRRWGPRHATGQSRNAVGTWLGLGEVAGAPGRRAGQRRELSRQGDQGQADPHAGIRPTGAGATPPCRWVTAARRPGDLRRRPAAGTDEAVPRNPVDRGGSYWGPTHRAIRRNAWDKRRGKPDRHAQGDLTLDGVSAGEG